MVCIHDERSEARATVAVCEEERGRGGRPGGGGGWRTKRCPGSRWDTQTPLSRSLSLSGRLSIFLRLGSCGLEPVDRKDRNPSCNVYGSIIPLGIGLFLMAISCIRRAHTGASIFASVMSPRTCRDLPRERGSSSAAARRPGRELLRRRRRESGSRIRQSLCPAPEATSKKNWQTMRAQGQRETD